MDSLPAVLVRKYRTKITKVIKSHLIMKCTIPRVEDTSRATVRIVKQGENTTSSQQVSRIRLAYSRNRGTDTHAPPRWLGVECRV